MKRLSITISQLYRYYLYSTEDEFLRRWITVHYTVYSMIALIKLLKLKTFWRETNPKRVSPLSFLKYSCSVDDELIKKQNMFSVPSIPSKNGGERLGEF